MPRPFTLSPLHGMIIDAKFFVDAMIKALESHDLSWYEVEEEGKNFIAWADECERLAKEVRV